LKIKEGLILGPYFNMVFFQELFSQFSDTKIGHLGVPLQYNICFEFG